MNFNSGRIATEELENKICYYRIMSSINPYDIRTIYEYGYALCALGRYREGIAKFNQALLLNPNDCNIFNCIALAYLNLHEYDVSLKYFDKALSINKNSALLYGNRGFVYAHMGDWKRAIICYDVALSIDPKFQQAILNREDALFNQANEFELQANFEESIKCFDKLLFKYGSHQALYINRAEILKLNNRFDDAIKCYDKCISIKKNTVEYIKAHLEKSSIFIELKRFREAIKMCNELISMKAINKKALTIAHEDRGSSYFFLKKYDQAAKSFKRAIELNSTDQTTENYRNILVTIKRFLELFCRQKKLVTSLKLDMNQFFTENSILTLILSMLSTLTSDPHKKICPHFSPKISFYHSTSSQIKSQDSKYWSKGTGFSTGSIIQQWDANKSTNQQQVREDQISCVFEILSNFIECCDGKFSYKVIEIFGDSCITNVFSSYLRNGSILDLSRRIPFYELMLKLIKSLNIHNKFRQLLSSCNIFDLIKDMKQLVDTYIKNTKLTGQESFPSLLIFLKATLKSAEKHSKLSIKQSNLKDTSKIDVEKYCEILKKFQFDSYPIVSENENGTFRANIPYYFELYLNQLVNNSNRAKRLAQEVVTISNSLPISDSSSIFVRCDQERLDVMKVMITGPQDTPYANGCFEFDVFFPANYPDSPPMINFKTTGNQIVRFNPNLYQNGKICLSILNTWEGRPEELWNSQTSSFLQILVSIQSLIFSSEPYFNEPGYELQSGTAVGTASSFEYNANIMQATIRWAMLEPLKNSPLCFKDPIRKHFKQKQQEIKTQCEKWSYQMEMHLNDEQIGQSVSISYSSLKSHMNQLFEEMNKLD